MRKLIFLILVGYLNILTAADKEPLWVEITRSPADISLIDGLTSTDGEISLVDSVSLGEVILEESKIYDKEGKEVYTYFLSVDQHGETVFFLPLNAPWKVGKYSYRFNVHSDFIQDIDYIIVEPFNILLHYEGYDGEYFYYDDGSSTFAGTFIEIPEQDSNAFFTNLVRKIHIRIDMTNLPTHEELERMMNKDGSGR